MKKGISILWILTGCFLNSLSLSAQVSPDYFLAQGIGQYQQGHYQQAVHYFSRALSLDSVREGSYRLLSMAYLADQQAQKSADVAQQGIERFPSQISLYWLAGEAQIQLRATSAALQHYQEVEKLHKAGGELPEQVHEGMLWERLGQLNSQLGSKALQAEKYEKALAYFKQANHYLPEQAFTYTNLSLAHLRLQQWEQALAVAESGLQKFPGQQNLIQAKASAYYQQKDYRSLSTIYEQLYKQNPQDLSVALSYAELLMANNDYQEASALYKQLLEEQPKEKKIYESLISVYESRMHYEGKASILQQMLEHFEDKAPLYQRLAETHEMMNRWEQARHYYDTLLQWQDDHGAIREKIAGTYLQQDSLARAEAIYHELLSAKPEDAVLLEQLGAVQEGQGHWQEALRTYRKLKRLQDNDKENTMARLGYVYEQLKDHENALSCYGQLIRWDSRNPLPYLGASRVMKPGQPDSSFQLAKKALKLSFEQLQRREKEMSALLSGNKDIAGLARHKEEIEEAKKMEERTTEAFHNFAAYEYERVKPVLLGLTEKFPASAKVQFFTGSFFYRHRKIDPALQHLQAAISLYPNLAEAHLIIGAIEHQKGNSYQAVLANERVLTLDPENKEAYQLLIKLYQKEGNLYQLCDKWRARYQANKKNRVLREHLIEALHKDGQYELARRIIEDK